MEMRYLRQISQGIQKKYLISNTLPGGQCPSTLGILQRAPGGTVALKPEFVMWNGWGTNDKKARTNATGVYHSYPTQLTGRSYPGARRISREKNAHRWRSEPGTFWVRK